MNNLDIENLDIKNSGAQAGGPRSASLRPQRAGAQAGGTGAGYVRPERAGTALQAGVHVWLVLAKASKALSARATRSIAALDLCPSDFGALEALLHKGPQPVNTLGRKLLLTSGSITTAVDRLERRGLVERRDDPSDRRARIVHLTAAGRRLIQKSFAAHAADMEQAVSGLTEQEQATLIALLKKLGKQAEGGE